MRRSGLVRVLSVLNRAVLGGCLLVSFTASASVDATRGFSIATYHPKQPANLLKSLSNTASIEASDGAEPLIIIPAHIGLGPEFSPGFATAPRYQEKLGAGAEERVNTLKKSDPLPAFLPSFDGQTPALGIVADSHANTLTNLGESRIIEGEGKVTVGSGLTPKADPVATTPRVVGATTLSVALLTVDRLSGGTEKDRYSGGISIVAKPLPVIRPTDPKPVFVSLIKPSDFAKEMHCLSEAVYFEARSEPEMGQAAVAQVVLNRLKSIYYPKTICEIVYQNQERYLGCEFTFTCEGKSLVVTDPDSWALAEKLARKVLEGAIYNAEVGDSTHYHADYVRPYWAKALEERDVIGRHIFYSLKPGLPGGVCPGCLLGKAAG
jgi:hypothetical protein